MKKKMSHMWVAIIVVSALVAAATAAALFVLKARRKWCGDDCFDCALEDYEEYDDYLPGHEAAEASGFTPPPAEEA